MSLIILNDEVTFSPDVIRANGIKESYSISSMITKHGFFIPLDMRSFNYLDVLDGVRKRIAKYNGIVPALLITRDRRVYELTLDGGVMVSRRLGYPGIRLYVRDVSTNTQEGLIAAHDMAYAAGKEVSGKSIIETMADHVTYYKRELVTYHIDELAKLVEEKFPEQK